MKPPDPRQGAAKAHNRQVWNQMARTQKRFTRAAADSDFVDPLQTLDQTGWLRSGLHGRRVLCLGAGGGRHAPLYAAAGAQVTVVDISPAQLELDRAVAAERRLTIRTVETSMDELEMFGDSEFDLVIQPVSTCYLPDLSPMYRHVARVTCAGGLYISQHKQPTSLQADHRPGEGAYGLLVPYYHNDPLPKVQGSLHREEGTLEFLHRWEELLGLMCRAGFAIEDLIEPFHADAQAAIGSFGHRSLYIAPYVRIKARRRQTAGRAAILNA